MSSAAFPARATKVLGVVTGENLPEFAFLLAASEIVDNPASPVKKAALLTICAMFAIGLVILCFAKVDVYAVAAGRVQSIGRSKVIQPFDAGRIRRVYVGNGTYVRRGAVLAELDSTESMAEREQSAHQLSEHRAEIARREAAAALDAATRGMPTIAFAAGISPKVRAREEAVLAADLGELRASLRSLDGKVAETDAQKAALRQTIASEHVLIDTLKQRVEIREALSREQWESSANVLDAKEALAREQDNLVENQGKLLQADAAIASLLRQKQEVVAKFVDENRQAQSAIEAKLDNVTQDLVKAEAKAARTRLSAPIDGTVQELAVTTIGQVVTSGQQLMTIVPDRAPVEVEALVLNRDIGFLAAGQSAVIKVDSFPYTIYGTLPGHVLTVSRDAVDAGSREKALPSADMAVQPIIGRGADSVGTPQTGDLVFPITVALDESFLRKDGKALPLGPGMTVTVEVKTGERRMIQYLLSPLVRMVSEAGHER